MDNAQIPDRQPLDLGFRVVGRIRQDFRVVRNRQIVRAENRIQAVDLVAVMTPIGRVR
jgi:hypothetical protein